METCGASSAAAQRVSPRARQRPREGEGVSFLECGDVTPLLFFSLEPKRRYIAALQKSGGSAALQNRSGHLARRAASLDLHGEVMQTPVAGARTGHVPLQLEAVRFDQLPIVSHHVLAGQPLGVVRPVKATALFQVRYAA